MYYDFISWHQQSLNYAKQLTDLFITDNPFNPLNYFPQGQSLANYWEIIANTNINYQKPNFEFVDKNIVEEEILTTKFCILKRISKIEDSPFAKVSKTKNQNKIKSSPKYLIVSPLSGNYAAVFNNFIELLLVHKPQAQVYITDWHNARDVALSAGEFNLEKNTNEIISFIKKAAPEHLILFSQSGNPALIALAKLQKQIPAQKSSIKTCLFLGVPFDTRINSTIGTVAKNLIDGLNGAFIEVPKTFNGCGRKVLPGIYQYQGFMSLNITRYIFEHINLLTQAVSGDKKIKLRAQKLKKALHSVMDLYAEYVIDNLQNVFINHKLIDNIYKVDGEKIDLFKIKNLRILTIEGLQDNLSPAGQCSAILPKLIHINEKENFKVNCGHYGLITGSKFEKQIFPKILEFTK